MRIVEDKECPFCGNKEMEYEKPITDVGNDIVRETKSRGYCYNCMRYSYMFERRKNGKIQCRVSFTNDVSIDEAMGDIDDREYD